MNHYKNKKCQTDTVDAAGPSNIVIVNRWADSIGVEPITIWRWRKLGWIETVNINGHVYVSRSQIAEFEKRAKAGEFCKKHIAPGNLRNKTKTTT